MSNNRSSYSYFSSTSNQYHSNINGDGLNPNPTMAQYTNGTTNGSHQNFAPSSYNKTSYSKITTTSTVYSPMPPSAATDDFIQDETLYFEKSRIQQLRDERKLSSALFPNLPIVISGIVIQKKTFTKWCNSYLNKVNATKISFCSNLDPPLGANGNK